MAEELERAVLQRGYQLLKDPKRWTYAAWARDRYDDRCDVFSEAVYRWSAYGALWKCATELGVTDRRTAMLLAMRAGNLCCPLPNTIRAVNDQCGYAAIMKLLGAGLEPGACSRAPPRGRNYRRWQREEARRLAELVRDDSL